MKSAFVALCLIGTLLSASSVIAEDVEFEVGAEQPAPAAATCECTAADLQGLREEAEQANVAGAKQVETLIAEMETVKAELETAKSTLQAKEAEAKEAKQAKEAKEAEADAAAKGFETQRAEAEAAHTSVVSKLQAKVAELEGSAAEKLSASAKGAADQIAELQAKAKKLEAAKAASSAEASKLQAQVSKLEAAAKAKTAADTSDVSTLRVKLNELEAIFSASDVQTFLNARNVTLESYATVQVNAQHYYSLASNHTADAYKVAAEHTAIAYQVASEHTAIAYEVASKHTEAACVATSDMYDHILLNVSADMYTQANTHYETALAPAVAPHIDTAKECFTMCVEFLTIKISLGLAELAKQVPAFEPHFKAHGEKAALFGAMSILLVPLGALGLLVYLAIVRRMSHLLAKLEYSLLFLLLGGVATIVALAFVTAKDPLALLRVGVPSQYMLLNYFGGWLCSSLMVIQFSVKGQQQRLSLVAALMVMGLTYHYKVMVYEKAGESGTFTIPFQVNGDGTPSFSEYMLGTLLVVLTSAMATPAGFRFSSRALLMALEGVVAGTLFALCTLNAVVPDAFGTLLKEPFAPHIAASVFALLALVLLSRFVLGIGWRIITLVHTMIVVAALRRPAGYVWASLSNEGTRGVIPSFVMLKAAVCLLLLLAFQVLLQEYSAPVKAKELTKKQQIKAAQAEAEGKTSKPAKKLK